MIPSSCHTLRTYCGPTFNIRMVMALLQLRSDFNDQDREDAIKSCQDVLDNYQEGKGIKNGFFDQMQKEIKVNSEQLGEKELNNKEEEEELKKENKEKTTKVVDFEEFLKKEDDEEEQQDADSGKEDDGKEINHDSYATNEADLEQEKVSDLVMEGKMEKKTYSSWQERFFQLKNGVLYWFLTKNSNKVQNKLPIAEIIKVESHKENKFIVIGEDKRDKVSGAKVYKFKCNSEEEKEKWINAITSE